MDPVGPAGVACRLQVSLPVRPFREQGDTEGVLLDSFHEEPEGTESPRVTKSCAVPDGWWRGHSQPPSALEPDLEATWNRGSPFWEKGASHGATAFSCTSRGCPSPPQRSPGECFRPYLCTGNPQRSGQCRGSPVHPLREWSLVTRLQCRYFL